MNEKVPFFVSNSSASRSLHQANRTLTDWTTACFPAKKRMVTTTCLLAVGCYIFRPCPRLLSTAILPSL